MYSWTWVFIFCTIWDGRRVFLERRSEHRKGKLHNPWTGRETNFASRQGWGLTIFIAWNIYINRPTTWMKQISEQVAGLKTIILTRFLICGYYTPNVSATHCSWVPSVSSFSTPSDTYEGRFDWIFPECPCWGYTPMEADSQVSSNLACSFAVSRITIFYDLLDASFPSVHRSSQASDSSLSPEKQSNHSRPAHLSLDCPWFPPNSAPLSDWANVLFSLLWSISEFDLF